MKSFLKWSGSKLKLLPDLQTRMPEKYNRYFEPFIGSGVLYFATLPDDAVISDVNRNLINCYKAIRDDVRKVISFLQIHEKLHDRDHYYLVRDSFASCCRFENAARLIYLNKTCFNGLYRENSKGAFNVPMGDYKNPLICDGELLHQISYLLKRSEIYCSSFDSVLDMAIEGDFIYFDPPYYPVSQTAKFTNYSKYDFNPYDQIRLANTCRKLDRMGVRWMLSNSDCDAVKELYSGFRIEIVTTHRSIGNAASRGRTNETLIRNY